jgi:sugar lactone lactonase YvrE
LSKVWLALSLIAVALGPDVLRSVDAIPASVAGRFRDPSGFERSSSGQYFVFDRRSQIVYGVDTRGNSAWEIVHIGNEPGRILNPFAFAVAADGSFAVADAPSNQERIQIFTPAGFRTGGFTLPGKPRARVVLDGLVLNGIGSLQYTGTSIYLSQPDTGSLVTEYTAAGAPLRSFGELRRTGHEDDPALHAALNIGLPLVDPNGGFFFVFQTGEPAFRKYDARGRLVFERRIQGREIDDFVNRLPSLWPRRDSAGGEIPFIAPTIRAAAVDASGRLWTSFTEPVTYVFDTEGDKVRAVQFRGAGPVSPNHMSFDEKGRMLVTPGLYVFDVK